MPGGQVLLKIIGLIRPGFEPTRFRCPNLPNWEMGALLIQPSRLVVRDGRGRMRLIVLVLFCSYQLINAERAIMA